MPTAPSTPPMQNKKSSRLILLPARLTFSVKFRRTQPSCVRLLPRRPRRRNILLLLLFCFPRPLPLQLCLQNRIHALHARWLALRYRRRRLPALARPPQSCPRVHGDGHDRRDLAPNLPHNRDIRSRDGATETCEWCRARGRHGYSRGCWRSGDLLRGVHRGTTAAYHHVTIRLIANSGERVVNFFWCRLGCWRGAGCRFADGGFGGWGWGRRWCGGW